MSFYLYADIYHKIHPDPQQVEATLLTMGVRCLDKHAREIVLDFDAMGHLVHGLQEGGHFNAYYDGYILSPDKSQTGVLGAALGLGRGWKAGKRARFAK